MLLSLPLKRWTKPRLLPDTGLRRAASMGARCALAVLGLSVFRPATAIAELDIRLVNARDPAVPLALADPDALRAELHLLATGADLQESAADVVLAHYSAAGWPVTAVEVAAESPDGLTVRIAEGIVGQALVEGGRPSQQAAVAREWSSLAGKVLTLPRIHRALDWIHRNPLHAATAGFSPGQEEASADAVLTLQSDDVFRLHGGWRNDGIAPLRRDRFSAGFEVADVAGFPFWLQADAQTSADTGEFASARGTLRAFLPGHNEMRLAGGWTRVETDAVVPGFPSSSALDFAWGSVRWLRPLPRAGSWQMDAGFGADIFRTTSTLEVAGLQASGTADAVHLTLEANALRLDGPDMSGLHAEAAYSPGGWTADAGDAQHAALRPGASARYFLLRARGWTRHEFASGSSLTLQGGGQWASDPVLPVQEFSPAGANTVRGFPESAVLGDSGLWGGVEFALPAWQPVARLTTLTIQPVAFLDAGYAHDAAASASETLASAGAGLRLRWAGHAALTCDWGQRLTEPGSRIHLALQVEF